MVMYILRAIVVILFTYLLLECFSEINRLTTQLESCIVNNERWIVLWETQCERRK